MFLLLRALRTNPRSCGVAILFWSFVVIGILVWISELIK